MIEIKVFPQHVEVIKLRDIRFYSTREDKEIASIDVGWDSLDIAQEILEILAHLNVECKIVEIDGD